MTSIVLDVETTTFNKGNPFDKRNSLVMVGVKLVEDNQYLRGQKRFLWENLLDKVLLVQAKQIIGFNIKFDLHWIRNHGVFPKEEVKIWDCQYAEFLFSSQQHKFPSLNATLEKYGLPLKLDVVKTEYWDKGIDTDKIPEDILWEYLKGDLDKTEQVYLIQKKMFETTHKHLYPLFKLHMQDLLVLEEMEWNGIKYNTEKALERAGEIKTELAQIEGEIRGLVGSDVYSLTSNPDVSAILYGGIICKDSKFPVGVFKTGAKVGEVRYKVIQKVYEFPRLTEPLKGTETKVETSKKEQDLINKGVLTKPREYWKVNEPILRQLKATGKAKKIISLLLRFNKLDKLKGTYLEGWSNLIDKMHWEKNTLHPQLNQCVAVTGRLSSSNPNGQNADKETKKYCESRL